MNTVNVLDCTLRDGGYINNWEFGYKNITEIISLLNDAKIDYIECGYLKPTRKYLKDFSIYEHYTNILDIITDNVISKKLTVMANLEDIQKIKTEEIPTIHTRLAFKPYQLNETIKLTEQLIKQNIPISLNPMHTSLYNKKELNTLLTFINNTNIKCITVVDTMGIMDEKDTLNIFEYINNNLKKEVAIGFHSHNNLKLSFENTKTLLNMQLSRDIIIDTCLMGMGRGAGILPTETLINYLNNDSNTLYDKTIVNKLINDYIKEYYNKYHWGYNYTYYLSAKNKCHPNYAKYLIDKNINDTNKLNKIFSAISEENKIKFDKEEIKTLINNLK